MDRSERIIRFGNDGWHARFDGGFTEDNVVRLADALGLAWGQDHPGGVVVVGYDTRHDACRLARVVAGTLASYGLATRLSDRVCPTPAVGWTCANTPGAVGGVILTSSERSCEYGGILVRGADGGSVSRTFLDQVEQLVSTVPTTSRGPFTTVDIMTPYMDGLRSMVDADVIRAAAPKVVVDPMYGAGRLCLAELLRSLGCVVSEMHAELMSDFGGIHPDPQDPWADKCEQAVITLGADMGIVLDGDGDRCCIIDEHGRILTSHQLIPLVLGELVEGRGMHGRVVTTLSSSVSVMRQAERLGCGFTSVPVAFLRLYREVREGDVLLAAEEYGGICIPDHLLERDGLLASLYMVELVSRTHMTVSELVADLESKIGRRCYARRDVRLDSGSTMVMRNVLPGFNPETFAGREPVEVSHAEGLRLSFADDAWVLMRPSRADNVVRVYAEATSERERDELLEAAFETVRTGI